MNPQFESRSWRVSINVHTGFLFNVRSGDAESPDYEILTVVPQSDLEDARSTIRQQEQYLWQFRILAAEQDEKIKDAESQILELEKQVSRYQTLVSAKDARIADREREIADLRSRIDSAAGKLDGALDDLAGPGDSTKYGLTDLGRAYIESTRPATDLDALYDALTRDITPIIEVGVAYKTRDGGIGIVVKNDEDDKYPFDVLGSGGGGWSVTPTGHEFITGESPDDLIQRIPFPQSTLPDPPAGFVYAGYGPLPVEDYSPDVMGWGPVRQVWIDSGLWAGDCRNTRYAVRIGSPVHFALASKFAAV